MAWFGAMAKAHEFWIEPKAHQIAPGSDVVASLRVGTEFEGSDQPYIPGNFVRFQFAQNGKAFKVPGVVGDRPAVNFEAETEGLMVLIHQTSNLGLTWDDWEKFENFLRHKDAEWALEEHLAKGLSQEKVREVYSRYAKSLVAVGAGAGKDVVAGLATELVALENPYTDQISDGLQVGLLYKGKPRRGAQVEVFERAPGGEVRIFTARTNAKGVANVPVRPGHSYMLDAVVLRRPQGQPADGPPFQWESLWANLTFAVPG